MHWRQNIGPKLASKQALMSQIVLVDPAPSNQIFYEQRENAHKCENSLILSDSARASFYTMKLKHSTGGETEVVFITDCPLILYTFENNNILNVYKVPTGQRELYIPLSLKSILAAMCPIFNILRLRSNETISKLVWISKAMF